MSIHCTEMELVSAVTAYTRIYEFTQKKPGATSTCVHGLSIRFT